MTTVVILQPSYLPWAGAFEQIYQSDIFIFYCDVAMTKNDWRNRNRIKTPNGWQWLTVPVLHKGQFGQLISETCINNDVNWKNIHRKIIKQSYSRAPYFDEYFSYFDAFYSETWKTVEEIAEASTKMLAKLLGMNKKFICSKELGVEGGQSERLLHICQHFGATRYYSGGAAKSYLNLQIFEEAGIQVEFQNYKHPVYSQLYGEFVPYMSVIDALFNEGPRSLEIITGGNK